MTPSVRLQRERHWASVLLMALTCLTVHAQTRATAKHHVVLTDGHGLLLEPDSTVQIWHTAWQKDRMDAVLGLGPNRSLPPYTLAPVPGLTNVVAAAVNSCCSYVVRADGKLLAWGINGGIGELGTTPPSVFETLASWGPDSNVPVPLAVKFDAVDVSTQNNHVLALTRDGRAFAWGAGDKGQLGVGPMPVIRFRTRSPSAMPYSPYPLEIPGLSGVVAISAGYTHSLAVLQDGTVRAWGENRWGEVGDGTTVQRNSPVAVPGVRNAVAVAAGHFFSAALLANGTVMTWGNRFGGALGRNPYSDNVADPTPMLVPGVAGVRSIVAGGSHVLALTEGGTVVSWGQGDFGALGRRDTSVPASIPGLSAVQSIAAQGGISIAVLATGRIMTWGFPVRPWTRPPEEGPYDNISNLPILLWLDGLDQP